MSLRNGTVRFLIAVLVGWTATMPATAASLTARVNVTASNGAERAKNESGTVLWLTSLETRAPAQNTSVHPHLTQKNKTFEPHVLAVQVGSQVDFPNRDPFFHNVFSLFNGKRFDLGLYEAGSTRGVRFDRAGICYIFCNIHPQMSAVVLVVDTPYFAVSDAQGDIVIPQVPAGRYQVNVWEEHCAARNLASLSRQISIADDATSLGTIHLQESREPVSAHLNKYGARYDPEVFSNPLYVNP
jgi:plastocyanin